ncbi:uncharacterized protein LOC141607527 [Silene latifolia]|uniref:uncharacterized protein LOC141607527 n=1 Tax=Silene latifolia TaxID=37657 RepID=UPI003D788B40
MVTKKGIEANPEQIKAILELQSPKFVKDIQKLTGRIAALKKFISKSSKRCKMAKWPVQLSTYDITFESRTTIKSQALVDFVADFSLNLESDFSKEANQLENKISYQEWILFTDGESIVRTGLGLVIKSPQGDIIAQAVSCEFKATNNKAEYKALITRLKVSLDLGVQNLKIKTDSLLIVNQIKGTYTEKDVKMILYLEYVKNLCAKFHSFDIEQISTDPNTQSDAQASLGSNFTPVIFDKLPIIHLLKPTTSKPEQVNPVNTDNDSWTRPYYDWF